jgi:hypothetical protein
MRRRFIQQKDGSLIEVDANYSAPLRTSAAVMGDIGPYKSMITGEMINGRRQHRDHLRQHNCVEVGNELDKAPQRSAAPPSGLKERLVEVFNSRT